MKANLEYGDYIVAMGNGEEDEDLLDALEFPDNPTTTPRCWVIATPGQRFSVHYRWDGLSRKGNKQGAGLFCVLTIDGIVVERAFSPFKTERGRLQREWQIPGKFFRREDGSAHQFPFQFGERMITPKASHEPATGCIRIVLYWARPNPDIANQYPPPTEALAKSIAESLAVPTGYPRFRACVDLKAPEPSDVIENNMQVEPVEEETYAFEFYHAHPDVFEDGVPMQSGIPAAQDAEQL